MNDLELEQAADYRVLELRGSGADIGAQLACSLQRMPSPFRKWLWEDDHEFLESCASILDDVAPWLWEELATFAEGIGLPAEQGLFVRGGILPHGCSAVAWRTPDGRVLAGRTYDFYARMHTRHLLITEPVDGYRHISMNGGLVGGRYDGINEHGLFVALHKVMADRPERNEPGVPYHLLPRLVLQSCRTAEQAADLIAVLPHLASFNYTLADAAGTFIALECYPGKPVHRRYGDEVLAITNHYTSPDLIPLQRNRPVQESYRRKAALEAVATRNSDPWQATRMTIADHGAGLCCHREFSTTLWAGVFDLGRRQAGYSFGAPCRRPINTWDLQQNQLAPLLVK